MRNIPVELVTRYEEAGWWTRETLGQVLAHGLQAAPDATFRVYSDVRPWSGTFADVEVVARRLAAGLRARGVGAGDVVAFQLPNWMEAAATFWASAFLGAALVPIVHFYGRKELAQIFAAAKPRVFITAEEFGRLTYQPDLCSDVEIVGVVGRDFDDLLADEPMPGTVAADPAGPALIAFTSGTTSAPKGVVHSHRSLVCEARQLSGQIRSIGDNQLTATPVGHFIGMLAALLIPVLNGGAVHLVDNWDPGVVLGLMERDGLTLGGGPPYFVTSLLDHPDCTPAHRARIKRLGLGGSTVPAAVTRRLTDLGVIVFRSYGSSEHPSITGSTPDAPEDKRLLTDGNPMPGVEIRLADDGEILSRGPDLCLGYVDDELTAAAFDEDGWYHTGDIGVLDADGYLTITDRKADVIIRGGENISALEVEEVLLGMPGIAEAVVVAAPDAVLGERVAAVLRLKPGQTLPSLDDVRAHFGRHGVARQKWPEICARSRRLSAHGKRQGAEAFSARRHCGNLWVRILFSQIAKEDSMGQLSHREDVPFPIFDADNHLYEPPEALTKFLPKEYKDYVQYVQINGRTKIAIRGQISNYIPNPTFEVVARPGAWEEYFKFGNPDGKTKRELFGEPMRAIPAFFEPGPRLEEMNKLGLDRTLMFPTLASLLEERLRDDPVAIHVLVHALNEWLDEVWGFNYQNRIFTTPVITLPIVEKAIEELEWAVKRGARCILVRPAPVPGFRGPRSFAVPEFDPFWERVVEHDLLVGMHSSDSGYSRYTSEWDGADQEMLPFQTNAMGILNEWRPIQDSVGSWVIHGALYRHPKLKVAIVEAGSKWMTPLLDGLAEVFRKAPEAFPSDPVEVVKNRIHVSPFFEDGIDDLVNLVGVDQVLYGSDWPHPEGLAEPTFYVNALSHLSLDDQAKIMGGNLGRLVTT